MQFDPNFDCNFKAIEESQRRKTSSAVHYVQYQNIKMSHEI